MYPPKSSKNQIEHAKSCDGPEKPAANYCPVTAQYFFLVAFLIHFLGVLSEPLRFFSRSEVRTNGGPEFAALGELMKPYSQWLYMNHGYFFFAPNPGPGHLIQCTSNPLSTLDTTTDDPNNSFRLPNRDEHWPRLLYHRYFMLSEFYSSRFAPAQVSEELKKDVEFMQGWASDKELYDQIRSSIVSSLKHSRNKENIELRRIERLLPDSRQVLRENWVLNDPRLINLLSESMIETAATVPADELPAKTQKEASR